MDSSIIIGLLPSLAYVKKLHPLTVHFPIAFCLGYCLVEFCATFIRRAQFAISARALIYLGVAGSVLAAAAGFVDRYASNLQPLLRYEEHRNFGLLTLCVSILIAVWRTIGASRRPFIVELVQLLIALCLGALLLRTADSGMLLAYSGAVEAPRGKVSDDVKMSPDVGENVPSELRELDFDEGAFNR